MPVGDYHLPTNSQYCTITTTNTIEPSDWTPITTTTIPSEKWTYTGKSWESLKPLLDPIPLNSQSVMLTEQMEAMAKRIEELEHKLALLTKLLPKVIELAEEPPVGRRELEV